MIVNGDVLRNFDACANSMREFAEIFPDGIDISPLWGDADEANAMWRYILNHDFLKRYVGWAIEVGILPARIRADLGGADLRNANLCGANLGGANLGGANLGGANLGGADLRNADLCGADLGGANLGGANLRNADLCGANLGGANLRGVHGLETEEKENETQDED